MSSDITFDAAAFERGLLAGVAGYEADARVALETFGEDAVTAMRALVPVDTGELRDSIGVVDAGTDKDGPYVDVGTTLERAIYTEFGTTDTPAEPFARPGIAQAEAKFGRGLRV